MEWKDYLISSAGQKTSEQFPLAGRYSSNLPGWRWQQFSALQLLQESLSRRTEKGHSLKRNNVNAFIQQNVQPALWIIPCKVRWEHLLFCKDIPEVHQRTAEICTLWGFLTQSPQCCCRKQEKTIKAALPWDFTGLNVYVAVILTHQR